MWRKIEMIELWDILYDAIDDARKGNVVKPKFPTRRWGDITTKEATTDKLSIERGLAILKSQGYQVRKRIDHHLTKAKWKSIGKKFYYIEIKKDE